jgi:putative ABC transport system permease protein
MLENYGIDSIKVALNNLLQQKIRSYLTLLGIVIGIAAIVALVSIGEGFNAFVVKQFESIGLDTIAVEPGNTTIASAFSKMQKNDAKLIEAIPGVEAVMELFETSSVATFKKQSTGVFLIGIDPSKQKYLEDTGYLSLAKGRLLENNDRFSIIISDGFAKDAFDTPLGLKEKIEINGQNYKIIGITKQSDVAFSGFGINNMVWLNSDILKTYFDENRPTEIMVKATSRDKVQDVVEKIERKLEQAHGEKDFQVMSTENIIKQAGVVLTLVQIVLIGLAAISLLVGGIGIMNTMLMAVMERTREIGVMKAIGATNERVLSIFLLEAGMIGLVGGIIGTIFGYLIALIVSFASKTAGFALPIEINFFVTIGALAFAMIVGMVSGFIPARRAAMLDPIEALRYE